MRFFSEGDASFVALRGMIMSRCETNESTSPENWMVYKFSTVFAAPFKFLVFLELKYMYTGEILTFCQRDYEALYCTFRYLYENRWMGFVEKYR